MPERWEDAIHEVIDIWWSDHDWTRGANPLQTQTEKESLKKQAFFPSQTPRTRRPSLRLKSLAKEKKGRN